MGVGMNPDVEVAVSYIEDARRYLPILHDEDDPNVVHTKATELLEGQLAKARQLLNKSGDGGRTTRAAYIALLGIEAGLTEEAVAKWSQVKTEAGFERWTRWVRTSVEKNKELVELDPSPRSYLMYGMALHFGGRGRDAMEPLRIAADGNDEEARDCARQLIADIASDESRSRSASQASAAKSGGGCAITLLLALFPLIAVFVVLSH
jgi:hypothetical protein